MRKQASMRAIIFVLYFLTGGFCDEDSFEWPRKFVTSTLKPYEIYLRNTFPTDWPTITAYDRENPHAYKTLVTSNFGTPLYAGLNNSLNERILVEAAFIHMRTLNAFKSVLIPKDVCLGPSDAVAVPSRKIVNIFHELNEPFEVPCMSCRLADAKSGSPKFFRIIRNRDVFVEDLIANSISVPDYLLERVDRGDMPGVHFLARSEENGELQGAPLLLPEFFDPEPKTRIDENGLSIFCAREEDGKLVPMDVIVNIDSLLPPPIFDDVVQNKLNQIEMKRLEVQDFVPWTEELAGKLPIKNEQLNLKLDVHWEEWSCCSSCCCSTATCGEGFGMNEAQCKLLDSFKSRRGFLSVFPLDSTKHVRLQGHIEAFLRARSVAVDADVHNATRLLEVFLSTAPYAITGIPVYSTLLQTNRAWMLTEAFLNDLFKYRVEANQTDNPFGRVGLFVDALTCHGEPQFLDCRQLQACRDRRKIEPVDPESFVRSDNGPSPPPKEPDDDGRQRLCEYRDKEIIRLSKKTSLIEVHEGLTYEFVVDEDEFGAVASAQWTSGTRPIATFDDSKSCGDQHLFTDGPVLNIIHVARKDSLRSYVVTAKLKASGETITLKLNLSFKEKSVGTKYAEQLRWWFVMAGVVVSALVVVAVGIYVYQAHVYKRKLAQAASKNKVQ